LYGVTIEDYDADRQVEILAAPVGYSNAPALNNRAYKWNGTRFVLWSDIPLE